MKDRRGEREVGEWEAAGSRREILRIEGENHPGRERLTESSHAGKVPFEYWGIGTFLTGFMARERAYRARERKGEGRGNPGEWTENKRKIPGVFPVTWSATPGALISIQGNLCRSQLLEKLEVGD